MRIYQCLHIPNFNEISSAVQVQYTDKFEIFKMASTLNANVPGDVTYRLIGDHTDYNYVGLQEF